MQKEILIQFAQAARYFREFGMIVSRDEDGNIINADEFSEHFGKLIVKRVAWGGGSLYRIKDIRAILGLE